MFEKRKMIKAIERGDLKAVTALLDKGVSADTRLAFRDVVLDLYNYAKYLKQDSIARQFFVHSSASRQGQYLKSIVCNDKVSFLEVLIQEHPWILEKRDLFEGMNPIQADFNWGSSSCAKYFIKNYPRLFFFF